MSSDVPGSGPAPEAAEKSTPESALSRRSFDRSKSPSERAGNASPVERSQQTLGSAAPIGADKRSHSPRASSPFSFPNASSASSTPVGTPTMPSTSLPFTAGGASTGRSGSVSGPSSTSDPFNFAGSPSLSNRPLEAAKHQHHRSRSINMGGFSPVMKGGKLINFGAGPVSISGPSGDSASSEGSSSSNPGSPLSSSPAGAQGLAAGFDPSALGPGFNYSIGQGLIGSTAPRAPSPLQQSHLATPTQHMDVEGSNNLSAPGSSNSPTIPPSFSSSSPSSQNISHNHRDSRTIDFSTAAKGWESPLITPTSLPLPIPIGQHSLSSLRAAAAASERARSPKPLSLGEPQVTASAVLGASLSSPEQPAPGTSPSVSMSASGGSHGPVRKTSGTSLGHDAILASPKFKNAALASPTASTAASVAASIAASTGGLSAGLPIISRPISPRIIAWPGTGSTISPGSSPSNSAFHFSSSPGARLGRPSSPASRAGPSSESTLSRGRTPSPSRLARDASGISRGASMSPPLDADAQMMRLRPSSPSSWDSSWPEVGSGSGAGGTRSMPIGLSSSPHGRAGGVSLQRGFSSGSNSSGGSPGTSPVAQSSSVFSSTAAGLGLGPAAWKLPSSPRSGGNKMLNPSSRQGRGTASNASRSRTPSPGAAHTSNRSERSASQDSDGDDSRPDPSSPISIRAHGENSSRTSPRDALFASRNRALSSSSNSSQGSEGGSIGEDSSQKLGKSAARSAHARTVSFDRALENGGHSPSRTFRSKSGDKHNRKVSDPIPGLKSPPSAMRIAHGSAKTEVDARQALSENTKGKAGVAGGLITDEVDAFSEQLPPPAIPARIPSDGLGSMGVDEADPLSRPVTSSSGSSHSPAAVLGTATASLNQLVRPTPVDGRLLPAFGSSAMARSGSGNSVTNALGLGAESMSGGLHSPHSPFATQMPASPRMGAAPLPMPLSERTLLGLRSRSPSPAAMMNPSAFDPLRRQSPSPSPLTNSYEAVNGESPPKMRSFIGMPPRSGYDLSDDPDDVGSEGDASSASSTDGREGSIGGGDDDNMDEKEDVDDAGSDARSQSERDHTMDNDDQEAQILPGGRRGIRGLPSEISRSTLFARRQNASASSSDGDVEDNKDSDREGDGDGDDLEGKEQRRGMRESRAPSPPTEDADSTSRPTYPRMPSLTRSSVVPPPPEADEDEAMGGNTMKSVLGFFHGEDPESQLGDSSDWGAPLSRQVGNSSRDLQFAPEVDDADTSLSKDSDWMPPSSQGPGSEGEDPSGESDEALTTLERIFLFAKSEMTYHRILVSQCLAEWILDVKLSDAVEYIIPLLNGLSTDEREVCEAFSPELHRIMWFFFRNCPLKQVEAAKKGKEAERPNGNAHVNGTAEETAIRPQLDVGTFTPLLCALLLNQHAGIARSTQNAIVQFCSRLHRDSEGTLLSEDGSWSPDFNGRCEGDHTFLITSTVNRDGNHISYEPYHFGPEARQIVEHEILHNVAIAIGSLNAHNPLDDRKQSTDATDHSVDAAIAQTEAPPNSTAATSDGQETDASSSQETTTSETGEISRDDSSWDPESQLDSQMEDVWRSDGGLFDASSPQMGSFNGGDFDEEAAVARMAGVSMLAALAAEGIIHVDIVTETFVPQMVGLQRDPAFFVRKEVAVSLGILAKAVTREGVVKDNLLPTLDAHLHDNIWHVRQAACLSMPAVLAKTDNETQRTHAVAYLRHLAGDVSKNVRSAALEIIGELVFLFHEKPGGVPEELIRFFLGEPIDGPDEEMADGAGGKKEHDSSSQSRFELSNVASEYGFGDALQINADSTWGGGMGGMFQQNDVNERAVVTAFNFPAVVYTMGAQHWSRLKALHAELAQDYAVKVRRSLASSLHEIAKIIGPEGTQADLLPIFGRFLQDHENEIKTAVVDNIDVFLAQLPLEHALSELRAMQERWLHAFGRDWRLRERLAQHISTMADTFLLSDEDANLIALMQLAIADPVSAVRDAGVLSIAKMYTIFSEHDQAAADGFLTLVDDLGNSNSYRIRVASLMAIEALIHGTIQRAALETILLERLVAAADDDVIDVRIVLARCVAAMCQKDELYGLTQSRGPQLLELISKLARDVSAEVRTPVQHLLSQEDAEVAEKDAQENITRAPKTSTRTLVLGPKDGGPHREARTSTFSAMSMDQSSDPDVDEDLPAFAMDEDVTEQSQRHQEQQTGPSPDVLAREGGPPAPPSPSTPMDAEMPSSSDNDTAADSSIGDVSRFANAADDDDDVFTGEGGADRSREFDGMGSVLTQRG
ncbi:hypothetical protein OC834_000581 [Tilletia horrida]|nr:hypothetical protein OC834_000581 [Tilletia horrida]